MNYRFTAEYDDGDDDRRPGWTVVEWFERNGDFSSGRVIEKHKTEAAAISAAIAYNLIHAYAY